MIAFLTDFADSALIVPVAFAVAALLVLLGQARNALVWSAVVAATLGVVLACKLTLAGCVPPSPLAEVRNPSGHTASAVMVYGGLIAALGGGSLATLAPSLAIAGVIGLSRVLLGVHTVAEAVIGGGIGLSGAAALAACWSQPAQRAQRRQLVLAASATVALLACALHGIHLPAELLIRRASHHLWPLHACPARVSGSS